MKLKISEDTACVASKTSYIDEDGLDKNGIYYFGKKPKLPVNWKDAFKTRNLTDGEARVYDEWLNAEAEHTGENIFDMIDKHRNKKKGMCEMKLIRESDNEIVDYIELDSKQVKDADGWLTDYTMYMKIETTRDKWLAFLQSANPENPEVPEDMIAGYVFVFGDKDFYNPNDGYDDFDWECDYENEAWLWFDSYTGFDDEDDMYESVLIESQSVADENGMFMQMDEAMEGLIGNVDDDDIDEVVRYYSTVSGKLGKKDKFSDIVCYFCSDFADVCDPIDSSKIYFGFKSVYKDRKFDSYVSSKYGDKFVIDHFNDNFMFTVYATNEDVINRLIDDLSNEYDNL